MCAGAWLVFSFFIRILELIRVFRPLWASIFSLMAKDKSVRNRLEQPQAGPKGENQGWLS